MDNMRELTPKQAAFVREYLIDLNATQAAIRAGVEFQRSSGFYVYFLVDPRNESIFYIGKGRGKRSSQHALKVKKGVFDNAHKCKLIDEIHQDGLKVKEIFFLSGVSEENAYLCERLMIEALRNHGLTNIANGVSSNIELTKFQAKTDLSRLKSFESWMMDMDEETLNLVNGVFGNPSNFYQNFQAELKSLC
jgi:hypothetical protein